MPAPVASDVYMLGGSTMPFARRQDGSAWRDARFGEADAGAGGE